MLSGSQLGLRDSNVVKLRMNEILKNKNFDELVYLTYTLDYMLPITSAGSITPEYSYFGRKLNKSTSSKVTYEYVNFIVFPSKEGKTHVLLSCLPEQKKSVLFIDQLDKLNDSLFERAISSLIIGHVENTFISPKIWHQLGTKGQKQLLYELQITEPTERSTMKSFFHSKLNLLHKRFKKNAT